MVAGCLVWVFAGPGDLVEPAAGARADFGCLDETVATFVPVISWHADRYGALKSRDLYKLLHQAVAGPGHAIRNPQMAQDWLNREWDSLGMPLEGELLLEPLSDDGHLVRLNLRPWRAAGRDRDAVLEAFLRTAELVAPPGDSIRARMEEIRSCHATLAGAAGLPPGKFDAFLAEKAVEGYPAVHHSEEYSAAYAPAYRVVLHDLVN
jgi:hypothetical protein